MVIEFLGDGNSNSVFTFCPATVPRVKQRLRAVQSAPNSALEYDVILVSA